MASIIRIVFEILVIAVAIYVVLKFIQGTRGAGVLKGLAIVFSVAFAALYIMALWLDFGAIKWLLEKIIALSVLMLLIIFQPEIRGGLVRLGQNPFFKNLVKTKSDVISEIIRAVESLSRKKVGALIAVERETGLRDYLEGGVRIDAEVSTELLCTLFWPGTILHDGAVIIQNNRVAGAGCLFPLTESPQVPKGMGTRHRAGIGITEETDAVVIVVSEETGRVSLAISGDIETNVDLGRLRKRLEDLCLEHVLAAVRAPEAEEGGE